MFISLSIFYYFYLILAAIFLIFTFFNVYHLLRFGVLGLGSIIIILFYLTVSLLMIVISWRYIAVIDWQQEIRLFPTA